MNKISKSALADAAGCSAQYIDKVQKIYPPIVDFIQDGTTAKGKPRIKVDKDGLLTKKFIADQLLKEPDPQKIKHKNKTKKKPKDKIYTFEEETTEDQPTPHATAVKYGTEEKHELEKKKLTLGNEKTQLEIDQKRGALIDKNLITSIFNKLGAIDENQIKTLNVTICPKMSAVYVESYSETTDKILKEIDKENDKELKTEINKILNSGESERIRKMTQIAEDDTGKILKNIWRLMDEYLNDMVKIDA